MSLKDKPQELYTSGILWIFFNRKKMVEIANTKLKQIRSYIWSASNKLKVVYKSWCESQTKSRIGNANLMQMSKIWNVGTLHKWIELSTEIEFIEVSRNLTMSHKANRKPLPNQEVDDANERITERNWTWNKIRRRRKLMD
jgi:hypothetical protein